MNRRLLKNVLVPLLLVAAIPAMSQRKFAHPGISYTQADLDRMKAMYEAKVEPFYSGFLALRDARFTTYRDYDRPLPKASNGEPVLWDDPNLWLGDFGQIAVNNALMWHITGDEYYARRAVAVLNRYGAVHSMKPYGTYPLDASKAYPLIEGAELMRDYSGWSAEDQQAFKDFLVYLGYTTKEDYWEKYESSDTLHNKVTIYWNIFQGDPGRHGNQGLYAMRCLMAMGIYLDNDTIYDRAYRKVMSMGHRPDDLPYPYGPRTGGVERTTKMSAFYRAWDQNPHYGHLHVGDTADYGGDDELKYWIYENGQCQESARDQGHIMDGMINFGNIASIAWNQGDDIFTAYDNRYLKGIIYANRYNYGWLNNHAHGEAYWQGEPDFEPTVENGQFLQRLSRNRAFLSLKVNPYSENDSTWSRGKRYYDPVQMLMAYKVRLCYPQDSVLWLQRAYDMDMDSLTRAGVTLSEMLTEYRTAWMSGDGGTFKDGAHVSGLPVMPGTIKAVDYDYFNTMVSGSGRTYYNKDVERTDNLYRTEGGLPIKEDDGTYVVTGPKDGAWMNYSFQTATTGTYEVKVKAKVGKDVTVGFAVDGSDEQTVTLSPTDGYSTISLGKLAVDAGARVLRVYVHNADDAVDIESISLEAMADEAAITYYRWNSRDYVSTSGSGSFRTDVSADNLYSTSYSSTTQPIFTMASKSLLYRIPTDNVYLVMKGRNLDHAALKSASYRLTDDGADVTKNSATGQANHFSAVLASGGTSYLDEETALVWKLDSSTSRRIKPLLGDCYSNTGESYVLRSLSFLVYGKSLHLSTQIDGVYFLSAAGLQDRFPELFTLTGVDAIHDSTLKSQDYNAPIFNLQGQKVAANGDAVSRLPKGVYIKAGRKFVKE